MASFQKKHLTFAHAAQFACPSRLQCFLLPPSRLGVVSSPCALVAEPTISKLCRTSWRLETLSTARSHHCSRLLNRSSHLYAIYLLSNRSHDPPSNPGPFLVHVALRRHHPRSGNCRHRGVVRLPGRPLRRARFERAQHASGDGRCCLLRLLHGPLREQFKTLKLWKADVLTALQMAVPCRIHERYHINPRKFLLAGLLCVVLALSVAVIMMAMDWPGDLENAACAGTGAAARWDCGVLFGCRYCVIIMLALVLLEILVAFYALPADNWEIPFPIDLFRRQRRENSEDEDEGIPLETLGDRSRPERSANSPAREIMLFGPFRHPGSPWSPEPEIETQGEVLFPKLPSHTGALSGGFFGIVADEIQGQVLHAAAAEPPPTPTPATRRHRRTASRNAGLEDD
ncbi:hypothetical protein IWX48DRAFT_131006 [Phyllosticta citricarpa]